MITCLHCHKTNVLSEHRCIYELTDLLAQEIAQIKEDNCGNAGLNWNDKYEDTKSAIITYLNK